MDRCWRERASGDYRGRQNRPMGMRGMPAKREAGGIGFMKHWEAKDKSRWCSCSFRTEKAEHWRRFIFPAAAFTPWHKSILASVPDLGYEVHVIVLEFLFWYWRLRIAYGKRRYL